MPIAPCTCCCCCRKCNRCLPPTVKATLSNLTFGCCVPPLGGAGCGCADCSADTTWMNGIEHTFKDAVLVQGGQPKCQQWSRFVCPGNPALNGGRAFKCYNDLCTLIRHQEACDILVDDGTPCTRFGGGYDLDVYCLYGSPHGPGKIVFALSFDFCCASGTRPVTNLMASREGENPFGGNGEYTDLGEVCDRNGFVSQSWDFCCTVKTGGGATIDAPICGRLNVYV